MIVAEDAEDKRSKEHLQALCNSLASQEPSLREALQRSPVSKGRYYEEYMLDKPSGLRLLLVAQGVKETEEIMV